MKNDFFIQRKTIKAEYARRIDEFFTLYGYKTNRVKVPNLTGRPQWNYVKTIDVNLIGGLPQTDMPKLKNIFDKGVTVWHNETNIGNYEMANGVA